MFRTETYLECRQFTCSFFPAMLLLLPVADRPLGSKNWSGAADLQAGEVASTLGVREPASRQHNNHFSRKRTVTHTRLLEESRSSQRHNFQCQ